MNGGLTKLIHPHGSTIHNNVPKPYKSGHVLVNVRATPTTTSSSSVSAPKLLDMRAPHELMVNKNKVKKGKKVKGKEAV